MIHGPTAGRRWEASAANNCTRGRGSWREASLSAAAAASRTRRRDGARGSSAGRNPAASSGPPPSASRASTSRASTAARSSAPFTADPRRRSRPAPASRSGGRATYDRVGLASIEPTRRRTARWRISVASASTTRTCIQRPTGVWRPAGCHRSRQGHGCPGQPPGLWYAASSSHSTREGGSVMPPS